MTLALMADFLYLPTVALPSDVVAVASYVDGTGGHPQYDAMVAKYPDLIHVAITALGATSLPAGPFFGDAEPGNGTVLGWVNWAQSMIANGRRPTLYCGLNVWYAQLEAALGTSVDYIVSNYPLNPPAVPPTPTTLPTGTNIVGWQFADAGAYDLSVVEPSWLGIDPPTPDPPPTPSSQGEPDVLGPITRPTEVPQANYVDYFTLVGQTVVHAALGSPPVAPENIPGTWLAMFNADWSGSRLVFVGLGTDNHLWGTTWANGWSPPYKVA